MGNGSRLGDHPLTVPPPSFEIPCLLDRGSAELRSGPEIRIVEDDPLVFHGAPHDRAEHLTAEGRNEVLCSRRTRRRVVPRFQVETRAPTKMRSAAIVGRMPYVDYDEVAAICSECGRIFRSDEALELHRKETHTVPESSVTSDPRVPSLTCSLCQRTFRSATGLQQHNRRAHPP